jgi:hypothetical protein
MPAATLRPRTARGPQSHLKAHGLKHLKKFLCQLRHSSALETAIKNLSAGNDAQQLRTSRPRAGGLDHARRTMALDVVDHAPLRPIPIEFLGERRDGGISAGEIKRKLSAHHDARREMSHDAAART